MNSNSDVDEALKQEEYKEVTVDKVSTSNMNERLKLFGWITKKRSHGKITFIDLYCKYKTIKCVIPKKVNDTFPLWTAINVFGTVVENKGRDSSEFEFLVESYHVVGSSSESYPINNESDVATLIEMGPLALRMPNRILFLRLRSHMLRIFRDFFYEREFTEITPPTLVETQVEGGSTLFKLSYFGKDAYLTQSSQLYLETVVPVSLNVFCIQSSYRAECSNTPRHLTEYTHVEAEMANIEFTGLLRTIEDLVKYVSKRFYNEMGNEIRKVYPDFENVIVPERFKVITYHDAIQYMRSHGFKKKDSNGEDFTFGDDVPDYAEKYLCDEFTSPIFLINFPVDGKPFYMNKIKDRPDLTESVDLLFPGVGEIVGGSMRSFRYDEMLEGFKRCGLAPEPYKWYTEVLRFGGVPHGGFGLGFERILMALMKWDNVKMACLYPRTVGRCAP